MIESIQTQRRSNPWVDRIKSRVGAERPVLFLWDFICSFAGMSLPDLWTPYTPDEIRMRMQGFDLQWYLVGGWALDIWHGRQTRDHEDIEICVLAEHVSQALAHLHPLKFYAAQAGQLTECDASDLAKTASQFWGLDTGLQAWRIDVMVERGTGEDWRYKRRPAMTRPRAKAILRSDGGMPFLAPEIILLFKAKACRPKDQIDFDLALPKLDPAACEWLYQSLQTAHPSHPWLERLQST